MTDSAMKPTLQRPEVPRIGASRPVVSGIMPSVVYAADTPDRLDAQYDGDAFGFTYAREGHPNADLLARRIARMEACEDGLVTASGMAAVAVVLMGLCRSGDHVLGADQLYGRSLRMMQDDLPRLGVETSFADPCDGAAFAAQIRPNTRLVLVEIVSNPTLRIADLTTISEACRKAGALLVVDNTFTTPAAITPFDHGADIVLHSVTKLLAGHADVTLGWLAAKDPELMAQLRIFWTTLGATPSPFDCWLADRGLSTFELRFDRAQQTAERLAAFLTTAPGVKQVLYPGMAEHPEAARAQSLLQGRGGNMVSFEIEGGRAAANAFVQGAGGIAFAPTLGDVGTTLSHPASSSHRALTPEARSALGMSEGFFRVSVGLEDCDALIACFQTGLEAAGRAL